MCAVMKDVETSKEERDFCMGPLAGAKIPTIHARQKKAVSHSVAIFATVPLDQQPNLIPGGLWNQQ